MEFLQELSPFIENVGFPALIFAIWYIYHQSQVKAFESVSFPKLENVGQCAMYYAFRRNTALRTASFPKLKILSGMYNSLTSAFYDCPNLEYVNLDSLEQMTKQALHEDF